MGAPVHRLKKWVDALKVDAGMPHNQVYCSSSFRKSKFCGRFFITICAGCRPDMVINMSFIEDIPNFYLLNDERYFYRAVPSDFWAKLFKAFHAARYQDKEVKQIVNNCVLLLGMQIPVTWEHEDLMVAFDEILRNLNDQVKSGRIDILMDCLCNFVVPEKFTIAQLDCFLLSCKIGYTCYEDEQKKFTWRIRDETKSVNTSHDQRLPKLFISHSSEDKDAVKAIVDFLEDMCVPKEKIFCSSIPEYGIPLGKDIFEYIKQQFVEFELHVIYILSSNYYNSPACLNEMGAAWVLQEKYTTFLLPGFQPIEIKGAINAAKMSIKLDECEDDLSYRLDELAKELRLEFALPDMERRKFMRYVSSLIERLK